MKVFSLKSFLVLAIILSFSVLIGCAGMEYAPKGPYLYYHKELPDAEKAVEAARAAGKDKQCPKEFKAAEDMKNNAYNEYWACRTEKAIAMANDATKMASSGGAEVDLPGGLRVRASGAANPAWVVEVVRGLRGIC